MSSDNEAPTASPASSPDRARKKRRALRSLKKRLRRHPWAAMAIAAGIGKARSNRNVVSENDQDALLSNTRSQQESSSAAARTGSSIVIASKHATEGSSGNSQVQTGDPSTKNMECLLESMLPVELRIQICSYLATVEVDKGIGAVSTVFRNEIVSSIALWKEYCQRTGKLHLPLKVSPCHFLEQIKHHHHNPYRMHYYRIPCVPQDFLSMESALLTVMSGEKKKRDEHSNNHNHNYCLGRGKVVIATYFAHKKNRIVHHVTHHHRSPSSQSSRGGLKSKDEVHVSFARGNIVSQKKAQTHWMRNRSELESLVNMHSRVIRVMATGGGNEACDDDGFWMYCRMF